MKQFKTMIDEINNSIDYFVKKANQSKSYRELHIYLLAIKQLYYKKETLRQYNRELRKLNNGIK